MSRTFVSRPAVSQQYRGRGRAQISNTIEKNRNDRRDSLIDAGTAAVAGERGNIRRGGSGNLRFGGVRARGLRGRGMEPRIQTDYSSETREGARQQQATYSGGFTIIPPNERRRRQVTEQAERETLQYEQFKQQNKPRTVSYVGTAGGGQIFSMVEARQQQIRTQTQHNKAGRLLKEQERRQCQRDAEKQELERKKAAARAQTEMNAQRLKTREEHLKNDMRRVNQDFLDKLEAKSKVTAHPPQTH